MYQAVAKPLSVWLCTCKVARKKLLKLQVHFILCHIIIPTAVGKWVCTFVWKQKPASFVCRQTSLQQTIHQTPQPLENYSSFLLLLGTDNTMLASLTVMSVHFLPCMCHFIPRADVSLAHLPPPPVLIHCDVIL